MTKTPRSRQPVAQTGNRPFGAVVAALVVIAVFIILGFVLANSAPRATQTASTAATSGATANDAATGATSAAVGEASVDPAVAARNNKYSTPPPMTIDPKKNYTATITTPRGDIQIKLRPDLAPETVNNFVFLAKDGFYDGVTWHRVLEGFMAQGGDPTGTGTGGPGYSIKDEFSPNVPFDKPGLVAMAKTAAPNSAGSQFFITKAAYPSLNGKYTIFGEVTKGQDIVDAIPLRDPDLSPSTPGEKIVKVTINEQ